MKKKVQVFGYTIIKTEPLSALKKYKNHRRLRVFFHKGVKCINPKCDKEGTLLTHGIDNFGGLHIDLCNDDFYPMTIDHRLPRSKGGKDTLENLDPMCSACNTRKGNGDSIPEKGLPKRKRPKGKKSFDIKVGDIVYKRIRTRLLGEVIEIKPNPQHPFKVLCAVIKEKDPKSLYSLSTLKKYKKVS